MSELRLASLSIPTAAVGRENPLVPLFTGPDLHQVDAVAARGDVSDADAEMRHNIGYGRVGSVAPYLMQEGYGRALVVSEHRVAILENDILRATFLLETGGRLWSLLHKPTDRELLHRNPIFQPANLALRNAWVAGGVEWNIGTIGHSPLTCEPIHAVRVALPDGSPGLRMYEFERIREVVFQIDAWLPDSSPVLYVRPRIVNPNDHEVPIYWWSNIAVPQTDDIRVLVPARTAWQFGYDGAVRRIAVPGHDGADLTYPCRSSSATDYFFAVDQPNRPWIAALDTAGSGLVQTSTERLRGRKLFQWGTGRGGEHWQEWLSGPGSAYLEIQAGLARTQLEHVPLPALESWSWVEAYGLLEVDAQAAHAESWDRAVAAASGALDSLVPRAHLDNVHESCRGWEDSEPAEVLHTGSGWGALERRLRRTRGDGSFQLPGTPFPDESMGGAQRPWLELLETGKMSNDRPDDPPESYQVCDRWTAFLESAVGWLPLLHLGVVRAAAGDHAGAATAWARSLELKPTAWAHRNLGALAAASGDRTVALGHYQAAVHLQPHLLPLALEQVDLLLDGGDGHLALDAVRAAPRALREAGRMKLAEARAALLTGDLARCGALLEFGIEIPDIREGEDVLHRLWFDFHAAKIAVERGQSIDEQLRAEVRATIGVPRHLDFRMTS